MGKSTIQSNFSENRESDQEHQLKGLTDGGHVIIECSNCRIPLIDIWITQPELDRTQRVRANCHNCGDSSFIKEVKGGTYFGITDYSNLADSDYDIIKENGKLIQIITVNTKKGLEKWKR